MPRRLSERPRHRRTSLLPGLYNVVSDVEFATPAYVDRYDQGRLHSAIRLPNEVEFAQAQYAALKPREEPV